MGLSLIRPIIFYFEELSLTVPELTGPKLSKCSHFLRNSSPTVVVVAP